MSQLPKITIITPSYNQGEFLEECIKSILAQNYPNLEYIIIDGGSSDNTLEVIKKYEKYIDYWISEKDKGQSHAINKGLEIATGDIINWLNADDFYVENTLHKVAQIFQEKKVLCVCGKCQVLENPNTPKHITNGTDIYKNNLAKTVGWARTDQPATFYHRDAIEKMGLLDEELHYLMDRDWWVKFLLHFGLESILKIDDILVNFRLHEASKTVSQNAAFAQDSYRYYAALARMHDLPDYAEFLEAQLEKPKAYQIKNLLPQDKSLIEAALNYHILLRGEEFYAQNQTKQARAFLAKIKPSFLSAEDQKHLRKLKFRNNYLPNWLIKKLRKK